MTLREQREVALTLVIASTLGVLVAFTPYHSDLNPDTIVVYLAALVKWTPFFWGQDRYGMLIPALTAWITDPFANVIVQNAAHVFGVACAFVLLARALVPAARGSVAAPWAFAIMAAFGGLGDLMNFLVPWQIYTTAMALALAGLAVGRRSFALGFALTACAEWVNFSIFLFTGLVVLARAAEVLGRAGWRAARGDLARGLALVLGGVGVGEVLRRTLGSGGGGGAYAPLPLGEALMGWLKIIKASAIDERSHWALLVVPPVVGLAIMGFARRRGRTRGRRSRLVARELGAALVVTFVYVMIVGASAFAKFNYYPRRYLIPSLMIWATAWAAVAVTHTPLGRPGAGPRAFAWLVTVVVLVARLGWPGPDAARRSLAEALAPRYLEVGPECTHVIGDYYRVWPVVFFARVMHRPLWGITYRSEVTAEYWRIARFRDPAICYWRDNEPEAFKFLAGISELRGFGRALERGSMIVLRRP